MENQGGTTITPQFISAIVGVIGLITAFFWTIADFRVSISELSTRVSNVSQRITDLDKRITEIDVGGSRKLLSSEIEIKALEERLQRMDEVTNDLGRALLQHNESMIDLYKKDMADGKRDYRIPPNAPKYQH